MSVLEVRDLSKSFGGVCAVDGVSFRVEPGELLALIGGVALESKIVRGQKQVARLESRGHLVEVSVAGRHTGDMFLAVIE